MLNLISLAVIAILLVPAVVGIKSAISTRKLKNATKLGLVKIIMLCKNGAIREYLEKPSGETVEIDGEAYELLETAKRIDPKYGIYTWVFREGNSIPIGVDKNDPYLNANMQYKLILEHAATMRSPIEKYFKTIMIAIFVIIGLLLLFSGGGGV
jgi:hypothetical protein